MKRIIACLLMGACLIGSVTLLTGCETGTKIPVPTQEQTSLSLPTSAEHILSLTISAGTERGESRSYTTSGKIQAFVDYFNSLELSRAPLQALGQTAGEPYEITLQTADDSEIVLRRANNLLRVDNGAWMEMTAEQSEQFDALFQKHLSDVARPLKVTVTTKTGEVELPLYLCSSLTMHEIDGKIHWFCADGYGLSIIYYDEEQGNQIPTLKSSEVLSLNLPANVTLQQKFTIFKKLRKYTSSTYQDKTWEDLKDLPEGEWYIVFSILTQGRYSVEEDRHEDAYYDCAFRYIVESDS